MSRGWTGAGFLVDGSRSAWRRFLGQWTQAGPKRVALWSPLVGVVAGLGAVVFHHALKLVVHIVQEGWMHFYAPPFGEGAPRLISFPGPWWLVLLVPTVGGLISGLIVFTWAPEAEGHGTDALIRAFHRGGGVIRGRIPLIKGLASIVTIGSGGSAGQEGPIAQIGAGFGSILATMLRFTANERRLLSLAGAAGGVGAIFRAPLGGAIFACEVIYSTTAMEAAALLPCLTSSIIAYSVFEQFITPRPIFLVPPLDYHGLYDLPLFAGLALLCAAVGWVYVRVFYGIRDKIFHPLPIPRHLKPALGGLLLGVMALKFPELMSGGYGWVQWGAIGLAPQLAMPTDAIFTPQLGAGTLLMLALLKTMSTGLTISSGGSGGVFGPSVFIGGMLGGAYGQWLQRILPGWNIEPAAFALVGMGGFFAGVSKTPLTSILMVSEMSGSYRLLVPLMAVCGLNLGLSRRWTIYEEQVPTPMDSPARRGEFAVDVLEQVRVGDVPIQRDGITLLPEATPFPSILNLVAHSPESLFPVVDAAGRLTGIISLRDLRPALFGVDGGGLVLATDIACRPVLSVTLDDDLHTAIRRLPELNVDQIPVVDPLDPARLVGLLDRREIVAAYGSKFTPKTAPARGVD